MFVMLVICISATAQSEDEIGSIRSFLCIEDEQDMDPDEVERLSDLLRSPLKINISERPRLLESGLMSSYQVASLLDYRQRCGDVLSLLELSSVDGFNEAFVKKLSPFISLETNLPAGKRHSDKVRIKNDLAVRGAVRISQKTCEWKYGFKYKLSIGDSWKLCAGMTEEYYSGSLSYSGRNISVVLGDFNARFGQGLVLWNGVFSSSFSNLENYMRKPTGVSHVSSFTASTAYTGLATALTFGKFTISALCAVPGIKKVKTRPQNLELLPALSLKWWSRYGALSLMHCGTISGIHDRAQIALESMTTSADAAFCVRGVNVYGELAYDWQKKVVSALAGTEFQAGENHRIGCVMRHLQTDRTNLAAGGNFSSGGYEPVHSGTFSIDAIYYHKKKDRDVLHNVQLKANLDWIWHISDKFTLKARLAERYRTWGRKSSTQLRSDLVTTLGDFSIIGRIHALYCRNFAVLGYVDGVCQKKTITCRIRTGLFKVDHWDDRIYVYEYDAPGSFNVPAFYGRGVWTAAYLSWKLTGGLKLYFRSSYISYPFMSAEKKKPGRAELKLNMVVRF